MDNKKFKNIEDILEEEDFGPGPVIVADCHHPNVYYSEEFDNFDDLDSDENTEE